MNKDETEILLKYIQKIQQLISEEYKFLKEKNDYSEQKIWDIECGLMRRKSGIYVPFKEHRVLYDCYHINLLEGFNTLFRNVLENHNNPIVNFALRSLLEIGIIRINVHFGLKDQEEEPKIRLANVLIDFALINQKHFQNLFNEEKSKLGPELQGLFEKFISSKDIKKLKKIRKIINTMYVTAFSKVNSYDFINAFNQEITYSNLSHFMHGDPFLITGLLKDTENLQWRVFSILIFSGLNTIKRVSDFIQQERNLTNGNKLIKEVDKLTENDYKNIIILLKSHIQK